MLSEIRFSSRMVEVGRRDEGYYVVVESVFECLDSSHELEM